MRGRVAAQSCALTRGGRQAAHRLRSRRPVEHVTERLLVNAEDLLVHAMHVGHPDDAVPSGLSEQGTKVCSIELSGLLHPSPTQEACAWVIAVLPSTLPESYDSAIFGTSDVDADGVTTG